MSRKDKAENFKKKNLFLSIFTLFLPPDKNSAAVIHPYQEVKAVNKHPKNMADNELYISNAEYHNDTTRISKSGLDEINRSPAHYYAKYLAADRVREKKTPALIAGSAAHCAVLEPLTFARQFALEPHVNKRTTKGREELELFIAANEGKTIIDLDTYEMCMRMRDSVMKHTAARELLSDGIAEQTIHWTDEDTDAACKCRPDWRTRSGIIVDLKTTEDASPLSFGRSSFKYRYHVQAAFYGDGLISAGLGFEGFAFIAVEKSPPYAVAMYYADDRIMSLGRDTYKRDLERYVMCQAKNLWPAYTEEVTPLQLPEYAFR